MRRLISIILILMLALVWTLPALADELQEAQDDKKSVDSEIDSVKQDMKKTQTEKNILEQNKETIENEENKENDVYEQLLEQLEELNIQIEQIAEAIKQAEQNYEEQRELLKTRLRVMYENMNNSYIEILLKSKNLTDFFERLELIITISKNDKQLVEMLDAAKKDVEYKKQLKEEDMQEVQSDTEEKRGEIEELKISRADVEEKIRISSSKLRRLEIQEDDLFRKSQQLVDEIKNLQRKSQYTGGEMVWPVPSGKRVVSKYGMRLHPIFRKWKMHTGIDIDGNYGASIIAANKGTVILAGYVTGYGNRVVIDHGGGITTLYAHCSRILVRVGNQVKTGEVIAKIGSTGYSTGPHLHFEVRENGKTTDPLKGYVSP